MSDCGWPAAVNATTLSQHPELNVRNPDTAAAYWAMPIPVQDGLRITLSGQYPESRYMSLSVYDESGTPFTVNGVSSTLTDYQITPDAASVNPWQQAAVSDEASYTVTLQPDVTPNQVNTLPLVPAGSTAATTVVIFLRLYVPADLGQAPLPTITVALNGTSRRLPTCPSETQANVPATYCAIPWVAREAPFCQSNGSRPTPTPVAPGNTGRIVPFSNPPVGQGGTPDKDTGYLSAMAIPPDNDDVLVIYAKAPTTPGGAYPTPWPAPGTDLRYWSLCVDQASFPIPVVSNILPDGSVDYGCRYDDQVKLDQDGYYTFVVGREDQRTAVEVIPNATFLPLSASNPIQMYKLNLRNMLANAAFAQAIQNVPSDGRPTSAAAVMGAYYPRMGFCSPATLAASGPNACLSAPASGDESVTSANSGFFGTIGGFFRRLVGSV